MATIDTKIHFKTEIKAPPEIIYDLVSTAEGWDSWFTTGMKFRLEKDAEVLFAWENWGADKVTETEKAVVLDFVQNKYLKFSWNFFLPEGPTTVEMALTPRSDSTVLEVTQTGFHDSIPGLNMLSQCAACWGEALTLLKIYAEHGIRYNG